MTAEKTAVGGASRLKNSLLAKTIAALIAALFVFAALTATAVFINARDDAYAEQDERLLEVAAALARADVASVLPRALTMDPQSFAQRMASDEPLPAGGMGMRMGMGMGMHRHGRMHERMAGMMGLTDEEATALRRTVLPAGEEVLVRLLSKRGQAVSTAFSQNLTSGLTTLELDGELHRLCLLFLPNGRYTAVAEPIAMQREVAQDQALRAVMPLFILMPLLAVLLCAILWRAFRPLRTAAEAARHRSASDLKPLPAESLPSEVQPFIEAVNDLLARVDAARTREIRFTADAAHELRSPLTSLTIEAEHLARLPLPDEAKFIVSNLEAGLERAVHQVSQLLLLARAQTGESKEALLRDAEPWHPAELVAELLEPLLAVMDKKHISFDAKGLDDPRPIEGVSRTAVGAILRNFLENAIRYTPDDGAVRLQAERSENALFFSVVDTGPGIPPKLRERVFDPFFRVAGSKVPGTGLGLAIVKTYAGMIGAEVTLDYARSAEEAAALGVDRGLSAQIRIPFDREGGKNSRSAESAELLD